VTLHDDTIVLNSDACCCILNEIHVNTNRPWLDDVVDRLKTEKGGTKEKEMNNQHYIQPLTGKCLRRLNEDCRYVFEVLICCLVFRESYCNESIL
jgi:hypothetical protein